MVAIKLQVGDDMRRFNLDDEQPAHVQFASLTARAAEFYPQLQGRVRLTWRGTRWYSAPLGHAQHNV
jgi:hypothetical protein